MGDREQMGAQEGEIEKGGNVEMRERQKRESEIAVER